MLTKGPAQGNGTWYRQAFADDRVPSVVFVLSAKDRRSGKPGLFDRRMDGILEAVHKVNPKLHVRCAYLQDASAVREAIGLASTGKSPTMTSATMQVQIAATEVRSLTRFYQAALCEWRSKPPGDPSLVAAAKDVRQVLDRLRTDLGT